MRAAAVLLVALAGLLAGCGLTTTSSSGLGYPAGPSLEEFGLRERCGRQDSACNDRALEIIAQILDGLGPRVETPAAQGPLEGQPDGLLVVTASRDPMFDFRAAGGSEGGTTDVVIDLTPSLRGDGNSYVVMEPGAYEIDPEGASALLDALFVRLD